MTPKKRNGNGRQTTRELVLQLRVALFGMNGKGGAIDGMQKKLERLDEEIKSLRHFRHAQGNNAGPLLMRLNDLSRAVGTLTGALPFKPLGYKKSKEHGDEMVLVEKED